jgi:hypothetical protein
MNDWTDLILNGDYGATYGGPEGFLFLMLFAFAVGHFIGFMYMWTHEALSYSRTFVGAIVILPLLIAIMMVVMAGSMLVAFGLFAVFGVIRFRNVLKDTRDTLYILWSISQGVAVGTGRYSTAFMATLGVAVAMVYLRVTSFGTRNRYDAVLTLRLTGDLVAQNTQLKDILRRHASRLNLASERRVSDGGMDLTYRVLLRDPSRCDELQTTLSKAQGFENVSIFMHEDEAEI